MREAESCLSSWLMIYGRKLSLIPFKKGEKILAHAFSRRALSSFRLMMSDLLATTTIGIQESARSRSDESIAAVRAQNGTLVDK
jgi:hypothetical protein